MIRNIEVVATPKEIADMLFDLDNKEVAQVFVHWKILFDQEYKRRKEAKENIWIFDLNHFMLHVVKELDNDGKEFFRSAYAHLIYTDCVDGIFRKVTDY